MMPRFLIAIVTAVLCATVAQAADIAARPIAKAPPLAPAYRWTGFYVGANAGYGWNAGPVTLSPTPALAPVFFPVLANANSGVGKAAGVIGGVQAGYNWQREHYLLGIEADFSGSGMRASRDSVFPVGVDRFVHTDQQLDWLATVRGRAGILAAPALLLYATGGLAFGQVETHGTFSTTVPNNLPACIAAAVGICMGASERTTKFGWTAGAGIEYALGSNWSVKAEYLYVDLEDSNPSGIDTRGPQPGPGIVAHSDNDFHIGRAGLNYRF